MAELLEEGRGRVAGPKTSGSKGLQLYVPLPGRPTWEKARDRAHGIAVQLEQDHPDLVVSNMRKSLRRRQGPHRLEPEPSGQDDGGRLLAAGRTGADGLHAGHLGRGRPTAHDGGDPSVLRFTADELHDRIAALGDLFAEV